MNKLKMAVWTVCILAMTIFGMGVQNVPAAEVGTSTEINDYLIQFADSDSDNATIAVPADSSKWNDAYTIWYRAFNMTGQSEKIEITSSNPDVIAITKDSAAGSVGGSTWYCYGSVKVQYKKIGMSKITAKVGTASCTMNYYVLPQDIQTVSAKQSGYAYTRVVWKAVPGCAGYIVERAPENSEEYVKVGTVKSGKTTALKVLVKKWNTTYKYRVTGYFMDGKTMRYNPNQSMSIVSGSTKAPTTKISSITKKGSSSFTIKWKKTSDAVRYQLYRATRENGTYKRIKTIKATKASTYSYTQKVTRGVTYYYKVQAVYPDGRKSNMASMSRMIPKSGTTKVTEQAGVSQQITSYGEYGGNWSDSDKTYYYSQGSKNYMVSVQMNGSLKIYSISSSLKMKLYKTIKINYEEWGGFYQGTDGNFYVAVGYRNLTQNDKKTVIKIIKYNSKWKQVKTASIKGNAKNTFKGIYIPFDAGNCRMDMSGTTLYVYTSRTMYAMSGVHHQSNISFTVNTKTMKVKEANENYPSHSFNQFARFKDGSLYLLDHGDAYPRSITATLINGYGTRNQTIKEVALMKFKGNTGDNYTGATLNGLEVGDTNILACGISRPQYSSVAGVKGNDYTLKNNVYVIAANKTTGKRTIKWLTTYNPKTSNVIVEECRMVKLADDRFAVMFSTVKNNKSSLHYVVVDNSGKKKYSKTYSGMEFHGSSQPLLSGGYLIWTETSYKADYSGTMTKTYRIPAKF